MNINLENLKMESIVEMKVVNGCIEQIECIFRNGNDLIKGVILLDEPTKFTLLFNQKEI